MNIRLGAFALLLGLLTGCKTEPYVDYSDAGLEARDDRALMEYVTGPRRTNGDLILAERARDVILARKAWDDKTKSDIRRSICFVGMTREQVLFAFGAPEHASKSVDGNGAREKWIFEFRYPAHHVVNVYLENDVLTSWDESR